MDSFASSFASTCKKYFATLFILVWNYVQYIIVTKKLQLTQELICHLAHVLLCPPCCLECLHFNLASSLNVTRSMIYKREPAYFKTLGWKPQRRSWKYGMIGGMMTSSGSWECCAKELYNKVFFRLTFESSFIHHYSINQLKPIRYLHTK